MAQLLSLSGCHSDQIPILSNFLALCYSLKIKWKCFILLFRRSWNIACYTRLFSHKNKFCALSTFSKTSLLFIISHSCLMYTYVFLFQVVIRPMMYIALTYDHRLIDGREAVLFLRKIKAAVEDPRIIVAGL